MGKGRSHHGGRNQNADGGDANNIINMDPEIRTNLLFPGKQSSLNEDETLMGGYGGRQSGSPSLLKTVFGAGWGRRPPGNVPSGLHNPADPRYQQNQELIDPFLRGAKQVSSFKIPIEILKYLFLFGVQNPC